ncbi:MAG: hypothetical protein ACT6RF_11580 [Allorhizobium sp.]|uniref:hypothetical protein n=1 Tax=Allorhizobium sp. TaxID=633478 RepID=UPI004034E6D7
MDKVTTASLDSATSSAAHVIAGFRYQLLHSVSALTALAEHETLHLEVSEDYSVTSPGAETSHQVKNSQAASGPPAYSLHSQTIRDSISRFWQASTGSSSERRLVFMARGGTAIERAHVFPNGQPGLLYWKAAAIDADTQPIRDALKALFKDQPLGNWLASEPSDEDLRTRLLRRISWQLELASAADLSVQVKDQLRPFYHERGWPVTLAETATKLLLERLLEVASRPVAADRKVTKNDLREIIEKTATDAYLAGGSSPTPAAVVNDRQDILFSELDVFPPAASRSEAVNDVLTQARGEPIIWLHGAHGVGKSTLAKLIANRTRGNWLVVDLWPVRNDEVSALAAWRELLRRVSSEALDGIIIDDFVDDAARTLAARLASLTRTISQRGIRIIITSHQAPSPGQLFDAGSNLRASIQAPYFTQADVAELVRLAPSPVETMVDGWAALLHITTRGGHPVLVMAKLASLRARNWPDEALFEDIASPVSEAIKLTREEARRELLATLRDLDESRSLEAGQLLRRAAAVFDRLDDALLLKLAAAEPALRNAGDLVALLKGAWLEILPLNDIRVSPLLADITDDVPQTELKSWRRLAAIHWLSTRKLNERTLPLCFWNAYWGEEDFALLKICEVMITMEMDTLRGAAPILAPVTFLRTDQALYPSNPTVGLYLRALQFQVADAVDKPDIAGAAARRFILEAEPLGDVRAMMMVTAAPRFLFSSSAHIGPSLRIEVALKIRECMPRAEELLGSDVMRAMTLPARFTPDMDLADFLFTTIINHIGGSEEELAAFKALDQCPADVRNRFLDAMSAIYDDPSVFVHSGWSREQTEGRDMTRSLVLYDEIKDIALGWQRSDVVAHVWCARSIILDEGLGRTGDAVAAIEDAIMEMGPLVPLLRQKVKVLRHLGREEEAAELLLHIEDTVGSGSPIERALALRDGALALTKSRRYPEAIRLFTKAREALLSNPLYRSLSVGFLIEKGLAHWLFGSKAEAVRFSSEALEEVENIDPLENRQSERAHYFARALVAAMFGDMDAATLPFTFGAASELQSGLDDAHGIELVPLPDCWRMLAAVEAAWGIDSGVEVLSFARQDGTFNPAIEKIIVVRRYEQIIRRAPATEVLSLSARLVMVLKASIDSAASGLKRVPLQAIQIENRSDSLADGLSAEVVASQLLDLVTRYVVAGKLQHEIARLREAVQQVLGSNPVTEAILDATAEDYVLPPDPPHHVVLASSIASVTKTVTATPSTRFVRDMALVVHLSSSLARAELEADVAALVIEGWRSVFERQRFLLRNPSSAVDALEAASCSKLWGLHSAAAVLIAVRDTVNHPFGESWMAVLAKIVARHAQQSSGAA